MRPGGSTEEYTTRFSKAVSDATSYSMNNTTVGDAFLTGFPEEWQAQINTGGTKL